jgi:hypothetical protein
MKFQSLIKQITDGFAASWNGRDMITLSKSLAENIVLRSPRINLLQPENSSGIIQSKQAVLAYLSEINTQHFAPLRLIELENEDKRVCCSGDLGDGTLQFRADLTVDEYGRITEIEINYQPY